ncbi:MAG TPA: sulfatase-like hydrolase/transferase [bacterium]|nr:sulfatase-like hydrolase/transferase [bacterium]
MRRRNFLRGMAAAPAVLLGAGGIRAGQRKRNVLIVLVDQERFPQHGDPAARPNRERLLSTSVEFTNHYCVYPLCSPSRASLFTGLYPHELNVHTNIDIACWNPSLDPAQPFLGTVFKQAGYDTGYFGKWHLTLGHRGERTLAQYGFDAGSLNELVAIGRDRPIARKAAHWIRTRKARPWLMVCSLVNPHDICLPWLDPLYPGNKDRPASVPPNLETNYTGFPEAIRNHRSLSDLRGRYQYVGDDWVKDERFYFDLIDDVDASLGLVLDALHDSGQEQDTAIIYTSDHGEMLGSHGLVNKGFIYEENLRVPLWISVPGRVTRHALRNDLSSHLDVLPTVCALAGVRWPVPLAGRDLDPAGNAGPPPPRQIFLEGAAGNLDHTPLWRGTFDGQWKYCRYINGDEQLFCLDQDPLELKNLAADPEAAADKKRLRASVDQWRARTNDPIKDRAP